MFPGTKSRNEGTFGCSPVPKTRTRAHSPTPPFYQTALLSPLEKSAFILRESAFWARSVTFPVLLFLGFFGFSQGFLSLPNPQNPWKRLRKHQITKEIPGFKFTKEIQKTKEKKDCHLGSVPLDALDKSICYACPW